MRGLSSPFVVHLLFLALGIGVAATASADVAPATPSTDPPLAKEERASEYVIENGTLVLLRDATRTVLPLGGPVLAIEQQGSRLYVARGLQGVAVYDISEPAAPRLLQEHATVGGSATEFRRIDGQLWVIVVSRGAFPLEESGTAVALPPAATLGVPADTAATAGTAAKASGAAADGDEVRVALGSVALRKVSPGTVELRAGSAQGVRVGDRFAVFRGKTIDHEGGAGFEGEEIVAYTEVVAVKDGSALAELSRSAVVLAGDKARRLHAEQGESNLLPLRVVHVGEVSAVLRPLVNVGSPLGLGMLAELSASYWGNAYFTGVRVQPLGLGWTDQGNIVSTTALLEAGYDGRAFAVGVGAGMSWVNGNIDHMLSSFSGTSADEGVAAPPVREERQVTHSAFSLSQQARLGGRDGLNLWINNLLLLHDPAGDDPSGFIYGGTMARLTVPVDRRSDVFVEGAGGVMGYWLAGAGVATWIVGNGSPGSLRLSISAGAAGIWGSREITETYTDPSGNPYSSTYSDDLDVAGPMVSLGLTRRFAL
jgi:hypothetical protein